MPKGVVVPHHAGSIFDEKGPGEKFQDVKASTHAIAKKFGKKAKIKVAVDAAVLWECNLHAKVSSKFHGEGHPNEIKQAAHLCFWIAKLKPIRSSIQAIDLLSILSEIKLLEGYFSEEELNVLDARNRISSSEFVALELLRKIVVPANKKIIEKYIMEEHQAKYFSEANNCDTRCRGLYTTILTSFRQHNHSARSMATLFEAIYKLNLAKEHINPDLVLSTGNSKFTFSA